MGGMGEREDKEGGEKRRRRKPGLSVPTGNISTQESGEW